ncbi:hypothetical protein ACFPVX_20240 [Cohnella faecalis]|uniref:Uncharacterized protein n=1 Tax=Cohnella faecalis TaxID=2315694 RepID=A0A398CLM1_9BACL|nr:hypothetical protein [Cohnella faecalis]RIE04236.1 hypothetical protein D3H35_06360 [Cohnella faecalis]
MRLLDSLFYWLQMKLVSEARPDDGAARETVLFFAQILSDDHQLTSFQIESKDELKWYVSYSDKDGAVKTVWFDREAAEMLLHDMGVYTKEDEE